MLSIPVKHSVGRYFAPAVMLDKLEARGQVTLATPAGPRRYRVAAVYYDYSNDRGVVVKRFLGVFLGIVSASPAWIGGRAAERPATTARWTPQTHDPDLPERPPRAV